MEKLSISAAVILFPPLNAANIANSRFFCKTHNVLTPAIMLQSFLNLEEFLS